MIKEIDSLINNGNLNSAILKAIEISKINDSLTKNFKALHARFNIYERDKRNGVIDIKHTTELNSIILSFLDLLEQLQEDTINNNRWAVKYEASFHEELFKFYLDHLEDEVKNGEYKDLGIYLNELTKVQELEFKVDKDYWYIIHWRFLLTFNNVEFTINKFEESRTPDKQISRLEKSENIKKEHKRLKTFLKKIFLKSVSDFGYPIFNIYVDEYVITQDGKFACYILFKSTMYPTQEDLENYPWRLVSKEM